MDLPLLAIPIFLLARWRPIRTRSGALVTPATTTSKYGGDFHEAVTWSRFGLPDPCPMQPLSPVKIMTIGSIFKIAGYRSTKNYLSAVKRLHIIDGHSWSGQLAVAAQAFKASTERGIGPAKQSCPLPWAKMVATDLDEHLTEERFPLCPNYCVVLFVFFFMRELECATAEYADLRIDEGP